MKDDIFIKQGIVIPSHELEITASRASGAGGQHVNKTETRVTIRWNVKTTSVLDEDQKNRVLKKLLSRLTDEGELIIHNSETRSQLQNKLAAIKQLADQVRKALHTPKKRLATRVPKGVKESRLQAKAHRSSIKKERSKRIQED